MISENNIFQKTKKEDYLREAIATAAFIETRRINTPNGIYWSLRDASSGKDIYYDEICLYAGSSGIIHYFLQLWEATGDEKYLEESKEAASYILYRWKNKQELGKNFSKWAFSTGYSGVGYVMLELHTVTKDPVYKNLVVEIIEKIINEAKPALNGEGFFWSSTYKGIVGDSGTILFLLYAADKLNISKWKEFAITAGKYFLTEVRNYDKGGRYYIGIDPSYFGFPEDYIDPNFPMGTAGIGYTLLRLYEESGDKVFLEAVEGLQEFYEAIALEDEDGALIPYSLPNVRKLFYLGYCHGPVGTARFFYKLYKITNDPKSLQWHNKLVKGIINAGAPEKHSPGYWNTHNQCCGTSGMTNLFLGVWAETGEEEYLDYAIRTGEQLLGFAYHVNENNELQTKWYQAIDRTSPERVTTPIGLYDGAAGIGWALLQLYLAEEGKFHITRALDDPYPLYR